MIDAAFFTIGQTRELLQSKQLSSEELTHGFLDRIAQLDNGLGAYLTVSSELALQQARDADRRLASGENGSLLGIPVAIKDILSTRGIVTTCGSRILEN